MQQVRKLRVCSQLQDELRARDGTVTVSIGALKTLPKALGVGDQPVTGRNTTRRLCLS
jgi:hypothetical protein